MNRISTGKVEPRLLESVDTLDRARVGVVGDMVADIYVSGKTDRISREAPVVIIKHEREWLLPGGAANVAANIASLGARAQMVGLLGDDESGRAVHDALARAGVGTEGVLLTNQHRTTTKTRFLAGARHTSRQQVLRVDREPGGPPLGSLKALLTERVERLDRQVDAWIVSDYGYDLFDAPFKAVMRQIAKSKPVVADSRFDIRSFKGVTLIKPNEDEAIAATSAVDGSPEQMELAAKELAELLEVQAVLVTLGNQGMLLCENNGQCSLLPAVGTDEIVDLTGAGDTVVAVLTAALAAGCSKLDATWLANYAASIVVMREGVATVTAADLTAAIQENGS
jgi:rfaE bifunctional protein kinase chain/domain